MGTPTKLVILPSPTKTTALLQYDKVLHVPVDKEINCRTHSGDTSANDDYGYIRKVLVGH